MYTLIKLLLKPEAQNLFFQKVVPLTSITLFIQTTLHWTVKLTAETWVEYTSHHPRHRCPLWWICTAQVTLQRGAEAAGVSCQPPADHLQQATRTPQLQSCLAQGLALPHVAQVHRQRQASQKGRALWAQCGTTWMSPAYCLQGWLRLCQPELHASSVSPSAQVCFLPSSSEIEPNKDPACQAPTQYLLPETLSRLCGCQKWSWKVFKKVAFSPPSWQCGLTFLIQVAWWSQGPAKTPFKFHLAIAAMLDGQVPIWRDFLG